MNTYIVKRVILKTNLSKNLSWDLRMNQSDNNTIRYETIYDNIPTKIVTVLTYLSVETLGNALWFGIIHYELFGGDPKKRTITNKGARLLS